MEQFDVHGMLALGHISLLAIALEMAVTIMPTQIEL
jgi:hypothetical protein